MFLIRFINKFFTQNLDERDLASSFERDQPMNASPSPDSLAELSYGGGGVSNGNGLPVSAATPTLPVTNGTGVAAAHAEHAPTDRENGGPVSNLAAYIDSIVDILIASPVGYVPFSPLNLRPTQTSWLRCDGSGVLAEIRSMCTRWKPSIPSSCCCRCGFTGRTWTLTHPSPISWRAAQCRSHTLNMLWRLVDIKTSLRIFFALLISLNEIEKKFGIFLRRRRGRGRGRGIQFIF